MNKRNVAEVVTALFAAAGRRVSELDYEVWGNAISDVRDELVDPTVDQLIREVDLREHFPTPALFRQTSRQIATRIDDQWSLPEPSSRITPPDEAKRNIAKLRQILKDKPITKRVPDEFPLPEVNLGWGDQCPEEHHGHCGQGPIRKREGE